VGIDDEGNVRGFHTATGNRSVHMEHFTERGEVMPESIFEPTAQPLSRPC